MAAGDAEIELDESFFGAVAHISISLGIAGDTAQVVGTPPQNTIEVDGFEIDFGWAREERALVDIEMKYRSLKINQPPLKLGIVGDGERTL